MSQDPFILAAQAREVLQNLHKRNDTVVKFKTNKSGYSEDELDALDEAAPGHFRADQKILTLNLDKLLNGKRMPDQLSKIEDWRKYPVLAGVAAHESAHARFSLWSSDGNEIPTQIPNPDYDPAAIDPETGDNPEPEFFSVSETGKLLELATLLEEPRVERLGVKTFTKTWRRAMQFSATHLIMEQADEDQLNDVSNLDSAVRTAVLVGGRVAAGTLGVSYESRQAVKRVMDAAQKVIETELEERIAAEPGFDPFYEIMGLINDAVFNNSHTDASEQLEIARKILKIVHPENADNPDNPSPNSDGDNDGEGEEGDGGGRGSSSAVSDALQEALQEAMDGLVSEMRKETRVEESQPETGAQDRGGHGATIYRDPRAPELDYTERPGDTDRALYRRALAWMENQIEPTVTEYEVGQWLPVGGARLDVRSYVRDNIAGHKASQRSDWNRVSETVKPAPPVKVAIMLDGSGSMSGFRRQSASIAWAAANAAAQLPESRTASVVFGAAAAVTQKPGHDPVRDIAVSKTNGPWENFGHAVDLIEDALQFDEPLEEGERTNTLIVVVSDLMFGGSADFRGQHNVPQGKVFSDVTQEWAERGYQTVVVGADPSRFNADGTPNYYSVSTKHVKLMSSVDELFKS